MTNEDLRRALEALRNGVPNRDAVRVLGCGQDRAVERFGQQLAAVDEAALDDRQAEGMLLAGGFGSGKSHTLEHLRHLALEANFVCSLIVVSKETPLFDLGKVFAAAAETAVAPGVTGDAIKEIALKLPEHSEAYGEFSGWANSAQSGIGQIFPATLLLQERLKNDPEMSEKVRGFWAGDTLPIADVRLGMKQIGQTAAFQIRTVSAKELPLQRFTFASRLIRAAGYRGWVLLIDEVELVARYSRLQRAKSYAELARWLGKIETEQISGLTAVATITEDFGAEMLHSKGDREYVVPLLESKNLADAAARAETGMRMIEREALYLAEPDDDALQRSYGTLKRIHAEAYAWSPPNLPSSRTSTTRRMRSYVRRWINEWDLHRLYPGEALDTVETELKTDYSESAELQHAPDDTQPDLFAGL